LNTGKEIEHLRGLLNKAIEMEADTDEIIKISQMLDKLIVEYMTFSSCQQTKLTGNDQQDLLENGDKDSNGEQST
jgi:hypothetical protein